ncbi:MAG TPA: hypothetical protein VE861_06205 [Gemmatimonadaceae bacterium]|nr:hypothetical protein [Gemmatimonadaceae bacterium]
MTTAEHTVITHPMVRRPPVTPVYGYFDTPQRVQEVLPPLARLGVPRDLIDVVVTAPAAGRLYAGKRRAMRPLWRFASLGGLFGLAGGAFVAFVLIAWPGFASPGPFAYALLFTPMITVVVGAGIGAGVSFLTRRKPSDWRLRIPPPGHDEILVVVRARGEEQVGLTLEVLQQQGGRGAQVLR